MKRLLRVVYKSTFIVTLVILLNSIALAQRDQQEGAVLRSKPFLSEQNERYDNLYEAMKAQNVLSTVHAEDLTAEWHLISDTGHQHTTPYYTLGNTLLFGKQEYLVTYRLVHSSDSEKREAQRHYESPITLRKQGRNTPILLKGSLLTLSLLSLSRNPSLHEIGRFDPKKDIAAAAPKVLIDRRISQANLKKIHLAVLMYTQDYDDKMPSMIPARNANEISALHLKNITKTTPVQNRLLPYVNNKGVFSQPTTRRPYLPNYQASQLTEEQVRTMSIPFNHSLGTDGTYNDASLLTDRQTEEISQRILFYEDAPDVEGMRNVLYADGQVKAIREGAFQYQRKEQGISESGYPPEVEHRIKTPQTSKTQE